MKGQIETTFDFEITKSNSLDYVGVVDALPVVVQSPTIEKLKTDIKNAVLVCISDSPSEISNTDIHVSVPTGTDQT